MVKKSGLFPQYQKKKSLSWLLAEKCSQCHIMGASSSINSLTTLRPYIAAAVIGRDV